MFTGKIDTHNFISDVLAVQVSSALTEAILKGTLKGGDRLIEKELQEQFGISRSPLREAFRDMEKKGLVVIIPRKGTFVKSITREDIEENFPVRAVLEALAAKQAFSRMTEEDLDKMAKTLLGMKTAVKENDTKAYWKFHLEFHECFIKASGNSVLVNLLQTLRMHSLWYRFAYQYYQEDLKKNLTVHQKIFDLFHDQRSDPYDLEALVKNHIEVANEKFLEYLKEQENNNGSTI